MQRDQKRSWIVFLFLVIVAVCSIGNPMLAWAAPWDGEGSAPSRPWYHPKSIQKSFKKRLMGNSKPAPEMSISNPRLTPQQGAMSIMAGKIVRSEHSLQLRAETLMAMAAYINSRSMNGQRDDFGIFLDQSASATWFSGVALLINKLRLVHSVEQYNAAIQELDKKRALVQNQSKAVPSESLRERYRREQQGLPEQKTPLQKLTDEREMFVGLRELVAPNDREQGQDMPSDPEFYARAANIVLEKMANAYGLCDEWSGLESAFAARMDQLFAASSEASNLDYNSFHDFCRFVAAHNKQFPELSQHLRQKFRLIESR